MDRISMMYAFLAAGFFSLWPFLNKNGRLPSHTSALLFVLGLACTIVCYAVAEQRRGVTLDLTWQGVAKTFLSGVVNGIGTIILIELGKRGAATLPYSVVNALIVVGAMLWGSYVFEGDRLDYRHSLMVVLVVTGIALPVILPTPRATTVAEAATITPPP